MFISSQVKLYIFVQLQASVEKVSPNEKKTSQNKDLKSIIQLKYIFCLIKFIYSIFLHYLQNPNNLLCVKKFNRWISILKL